MAELFTTTPAPIALADPFGDGASRYTSKKLFKVGSTFYCCGGFGDTGAVKTTTPQTAPWSALLGTFPAPPSGGFFVNSSQCIALDDDNSKIHVFLRKSGSPFHLHHVHLDLGSDTWNTPVDSGQGVTQFVAKQLSNGDYLVVYSGPSAGDPIKVMTYSGGSWGSPSTLVSPGGSDRLTPVALFIDASDNAVLLYQYSQVSPAVSFLYSITYASGTPGSPVLVEDFSAVTPSPGVNTTNYQGGTTLVDVVKDQLLVGGWSRSGLSPVHVYLWVGSPISNPTWTKFTVATLVGTNNSDFGTDLVMANGTDPWIIWLDNKFSAPITAQINAAPFDGLAIGTQEILWDGYGSNAVPGTGLGPGDIDVSYPTAIILSGFNAGMLVYTEVDGSFDESYVYIAGTFPGGSPPTPSAKRPKFTVQVI